MKLRDVKQEHFFNLREDLKGTGENTSDYYRRSEVRCNRLYTFFVNVETQNAYYYWTDLND